MGESSGGLRSFLNGSPAFSALVVIIIIVAAALTWYFTHPPVGHGNYYYTDDDGKTYFAGPVQATPYMRDGKEVVEAKVFKCTGGTPFVAYLRRYPDNVRARVAEQFKMDKPGLLPPSEVKRPGDKNWVMQGAGPALASNIPAGAGGPATGPSALEITEPKCPDGRFAVPQMPPH